MEVVVQEDRPVVAVMITVVDVILIGDELNVDKCPASSPILAHAPSVIMVLLVLPILHLHGVLPGIGVGLSSGDVVHIPSPLP